MEDLGGEVVGGEGAGEPVDGGAAFFHAAEPGHLALGELVDGDFQLAEHFFFGQLADDVLGDEFVFQAVIDEVFGVNALLVDKAAHLVDHAFVQTGAQAAADAFAAGVTIDLNADDQGVLHVMWLGEGL